MRTKVIAIGNRLMGDDGIALKVAEQIKTDLEDADMEIIIGETDFWYCISKIKEGDFLIIIDACLCNLPIGTIKVIPLGKFKQGKNSEITEHDSSLILLLNYYFHDITGYIIGIEAGQITLSSSLSEDLQIKFMSICNEVIEKIRLIVKKRIQES